MMGTATVISHVTDNDIVPQLAVDPVDMGLSHSPVQRALLIRTAQRF